MLDMFCFVKLLCVFVINVSVRIVSLYKERSPAGVNRSGLFFVCFCSSQRSNRRTLFHYFSINTDRLFALAGYLV